MINWQARPEAVGYLRPGFGHVIQLSGGGSGVEGTGAARRRRPTATSRPAWTLALRTGSRPRRPLVWPISKGSCRKILSLPRPYP